MSRTLYEKPEKEMHSFPGLMERNKMPIAQPVQQQQPTGATVVTEQKKTLNLKKK